MGIGADGPGLYNYTRGSPVTLSDPSGNRTHGDEHVEAAKGARPARKAQASVTTSSGDDSEPPQCVLPDAVDELQKDSSALPGGPS